MGIGADRPRLAAAPPRAYIGRLLERDAQTAIVRARVFAIGPVRYESRVVGCDAAVQRDRSRALGTIHIARHAAPLAAINRTIARLRKKTGSRLLVKALVQLRAGKLRGSGHHISE